MQRAFFYLFVCWGILAPAIMAYAETADKGPSEESLIAAWEKVQRDDPKTLVFEKKGDRLYHFVTERFPYDGDLMVLNVTIEKLPGSMSGETYHGVLEVELTNLPPDFFQKYSYSYSNWQRRNFLYYNSEKGQWQTSTQWSETWEEEFTEPAGMFDNNGLLWLGIVACVLAVFGVVQHRAMRQISRSLLHQETALSNQQRAMNIMERNLDISEQNLKAQKENNKTLKRILMALESKQGD